MHARHEQKASEATFWGGGERAEEAESVRSEAACVRTVSRMHLTMFSTVCRLSGQQCAELGSYLVEKQVLLGGLHHRLHVSYERARGTDMAQDDSGKGWVSEADNAVNSRGMGRCKQSTRQDEDRGRIAR